MYIKNVLNLQQKQLKNLDRGEWSCLKCHTDMYPDNTTSIEDEVCNLNDSPQFSVTDIDFKKYDNMSFNPLRFDSNNTEKAYNDIVDSNNGGIHECSYLTPEQFRRDLNVTRGNFNLLNVNIRSLAKNFDELKACMKVVNTEFNVIGLCETHLKDKPCDYLNLPGYNIEYTNRVGREKGGCVYAYIR